MTFTLKRRAFAGLLTTGAIAFAAGQARAATLAAPAGKIILTISGKIGTVNQDQAAAFDREMLEALGVESLTTSTPWYDQPTKFEGISLAALLAAVNAKGEFLTVVALDDYSIEIPISDFNKYNVILALKRDGQYMPVREKGPLFIVYPFDSVPELKHQKYYSRSAWQVSQLIVK